MSIGYQTTVDYLPELLPINCRFNRKRTATQASDSATGLRLLCWSPKGKFLAQQEISKLPYQLGLLQRLEKFYAFSFCFYGKFPRSF